jgi:hypothetical protein
MRWLSHLYIAFLHSDGGGVAEVNEELHCVLINVPDGDLSLAALCQLAGEHGMEVRGACRQDHPVREDLALAHDEYHIAEFAVFAQHIDGLQSGARVLVRRVGQACGRRGPLHGRRRRTRRRIHPATAQVHRRHSNIWN